MIPRALATPLHIGEQLGALVGRVVVLAVENEDGILVDIFLEWHEVEGGYEASDPQRTLTMTTWGAVHDIWCAARRRPGGSYEARHGERGTAAARPNPPGQRWAGYRGRGRRAAL